MTFVYSYTLVLINADNTSAENLQDYHFKEYVEKKTAKQGQNLGEVE